MERADFEALRDLPGKVIEENMAFIASKDARPHLFLPTVTVKNTGNHVVSLEGWFNPNIWSLGFTFLVHGTGPVCRLEINGKVHGVAGRTHKHDLHKVADPRLNLPTAVPRKELEGKSPAEIWQILCQQANISHTGTFIDPLS